ncbi:hypothetical protein [Nitrososphaera viennensis]|uniref:Uncharacterized protein n=2 Tax=Nitrososphaera viennensis TaxID=1034015 RepID=A0A060HP05_9ARCH|nr:hypothetical protein [Nitrososphaera viennensis]AIC15301.1 hypothetical protein NVIE_010740 [Nitrososphaera viennensis EN76]UVS70203.1 hypothetical protein NWT39_05300 [Nitrososphaera viennensis]
MTVRDSRHVSLQKSRGLAVAGAGAASGLIGSLAVSALILLGERVAGLPVGTFYLMLVSAVSQAQDYNTYAIVQGLLLHMLAGTAIGLAVSAPFAISKKAYASLGRLAPAYGLGAGALVWAALFLPVTYGTMMPLLQSLDGQSVVSQRAPIGTLFSIAVSDMLAMIDRIIYTALAFNMLFGLVTLVLTRAFSEAAIGR